MIEAHKVTDSGPACIYPRSVAGLLSAIKHEIFSVISLLPNVFLLTVHYILMLY